jgi:ABC-type multidrug transport system ATPase subunit
VFLEVPKNEMLCLLGHNGAGKSTLFNMMTGMIGASSGEGWIYGLNIKENQDEIRKIMGVVPQFDILWDQMTAMEHMKMFCKIKGVLNHEIE